MQKRRVPAPEAPRLLRNGSRKDVASRNGTPAVPCPHDTLIRSRTENVRLFYGQTPVAGQILGRTGKRNRPTRGATRRPAWKGGMEEKSMKISGYPGELTTFDISLVHERPGKSRFKLFPCLKHFAMKTFSPFAFRIPCTLPR